MHILTFAFYVASAAAYAAHFARRDRRSGQLATSLLVAAAVAHTFLIGMARMQAGYMPVVGTTAAISFFVWLLAAQVVILSQGWELYQGTAGRIESQPE